jgi:sec-independent protein translocase protein TatC
VTVIPKVLRRRTPEERTGTMTVMEHLEELRHRLIVCTVAVAVGAIIAWPLYGPFRDLIQHPYCSYVHTLPRPNRPPAGCNLVFTGLLDAMLVKLKIVLYLGVAFSLPVLLYQLWAFIVPGLHDRERKMVIPFIASSTVLFAAGAVFAYLLLPRGLNFLLGFAGSGVVPLISFDHYVAFVVLLSIAFGISFEYPVLLIFLLLVGVLTTSQLRKARRFAILGTAVFAAVITPSSDIYTMLGLWIPMVLFYEAAIIVGRLLKR